MRVLEDQLRKFRTMVPTLYVEFVLVALSSILVSDVYSKSPNCGIASSGRLNAEGATPWMVAITKKSRDGKYDFYCNGFLIDRRHVLTVAHCVHGKTDVSNFSTRIGKMNWKEGEEYEITCITAHPRYEPRQYSNDIAILTLSRDVDTPNYSPICLPDEVLKSRSLDGLKVTKAAWGTESPFALVGSTLTQTPGLQIISNQECNKKFTGLFSGFRRQFPDGLKSDKLCTDSPTGRSDICAADSGGPLMYKDNTNRWIAFGIISFGYGCGIGPTGYTRVSEYVEWIAENTRDNKSDC